MAGHLVSGVVILICQKLVKRGCHFQQQIWGDTEDAK